MIAGWLLLLVSLLYVGLLFVVAYAGDRRPLYPRQPRLRPLVYSLALAVYCSSWTFYGAVGTAAREGLSYLPIYLGPVVYSMTEKQLEGIRELAAVLQPAVLP